MGKVMHIFALANFWIRPIFKMFNTKWVLPRYYGAVHLSRNSAIQFLNPSFRIDILFKVLGNQNKGVLSRIDHCLVGISDLQNVTPHHLILLYFQVVILPISKWYLSTLILCCRFLFTFDPIFCIICRCQIERDNKNIN